MRGGIHSKAEAALAPTLRDDAVHFVDGGADGDPVRDRRGEEGRQVKRQPIITRADDDVVVALHAERLFPHVFEYTAGAGFGDGAAIGSGGAGTHAALHLKYGHCRGGHNASRRRDDSDLVSAGYENGREIQQMRFDSACFTGTDGTYGGGDDQDAVAERHAYYNKGRMKTIGKAVCLLSGGLDSSTCLALARREGYECYALSFDYGQRHRVELEAAARVAAALGAVRHVVARIDLRQIGHSALTDDVAVPKGRTAEDMSQGIPVTYVPARNTIFLSFALAWAEVLEAPHIFIGVNALDYSGYPDCRPEFIEAYERMANLATKAGVEGTLRVRIHTPLLRLSKAEIVKLGQDLGLDFGLTHSCYDPDAAGRPCGQCDSCLLRRKGFEEAGIADR